LWTFPGFLEKKKITYRWLLEIKQKRNRRRISAEINFCVENLASRGHPTNAVDIK
jgi:hypothetical protein